MLQELPKEVTQKVLEALLAKVQEMMLQAGETQTPQAPGAEPVPEDGEEPETPVEPSEEVSEEPDEDEDWRAGLKSYMQDGHRPSPVKGALAGQMDDGAPRARKVKK